MKAMIISGLLIAVLLAEAARGGSMDIAPAELNSRIRCLTDKFQAFQRTEKAIPPEVLRRVQGVLLLDLSRTGFLCDDQAAGGVTIVRDPQSGKWSPAAFVEAEAASSGVNARGQDHFYIVLFMTTNSIQLLTNKQFELGQPGPDLAIGERNNAEGAPRPAQIAVYDLQHGRYADAPIPGGALLPDANANQAYCGRKVGMADILFGHDVTPSVAAMRLADKIDAYSQAIEAGTKISKS